MNTQTDILTNEIFVLQRRRTLLPLWIKIFIWIFMILASMTPVVLLLGAFNGYAKLAIFGLETMDPFSVQGLLIISIFLYNGIVAFMLWTEKGNAVELALYAAYLNAAICIASMIIAFANNHISIRLEIVVLILFISKLKKIKAAWSTGVDKSQLN